MEKQLPLHPIVQGTNFFYDFLSGETFELLAESIWGEFSVFSSSGFWSVLNGVKAVIYDIIGAWSDNSKQRQKLFY